ncbi:MAG: AAA family ATPase [Cyanobacteria bacterium P01_A01_bin.114]
MLKVLKIENFRSFESFELQNVGRINLLIGENNSGKTSLLEAIYLLKSGINLLPLYEVIQNRAEYLSGDQKSRPDLDIKLLFHQRNPQLEDYFLVESLATDGAQALVRYELHKNSSDFQRGVSGDLVEHHRGFTLAVSALNRENQALEMPLNADIGLPQKYIRQFSQQAGLEQYQFFAPALSNRRKLNALFEAIELTPKETDLYEILKVIEPSICRIAPQRAHADEFKVLLEGAEEPIPLKNLGSGVWHLLGLALSLVNAAGGLLMVDNMDVGLHGGMLPDLWRLIWETANKLDIQVFATTHSRDCWQSLAEIAAREDADGNDIRLHNIKKGAEQSVTLDHRQLIGATKRRKQKR